MKAITLWQPWATLVAIGAKRIETRSWRPAGDGCLWLAIHAASLKSTPAKARYLADREPFRTALAAAGHHTEEMFDLPFGCIVAVARVAGYVYCSGQSIWPQEPERSFGDYTRDRWAWVFDEVRRLPVPIPARGHQGLWEWEPPEGFIL